MLRVTVSYSDNDNAEGFVSDTLRHEHHRVMKVVKHKKEGTHKKLDMYLSNKK